MSFTVDAATARACGCAIDGDALVELATLVRTERNLQCAVNACFSVSPARPLYWHWVIDIFEARRMAALRVLPVFERACPKDVRARRVLDALPAWYAAARVAVDNGLYEAHDALDEAADRAYQVSTAAGLAATAAQHAYAPAVLADVP